jgi:protein ImuB
MGARRLRLTARRVDGGDRGAEIRLARPGRDPMRLRDLFAPKLVEIDAGFGIDALRLAALEVEPLRPAQLSQRHRETEAARLADLVSRLGNRIGFENVVRFLPAESHAPERAQIVAAAAHSEPEPLAWTRAWAGPPRPILIFPPERLGIPPAPPAASAQKRAAIPAGHSLGAGRRHPPPASPPPLRRGAEGEVAAAPGPQPAAPPPAFAWRNRRLTTLRAHGPERLAPEWWLDDPAWASGLRDYWRVETAEGPRLWLFHTPADPAAGPAWYAHGCFA